MRRILLIAMLCSLASGLPANAEDFAASSTVAHKTATRVLDSKNHVVGTLFVLPFRAAALVGFNGTFYLLPVSSEGFFGTPEPISYLFEGSNCTGQAAIGVNPNMVPLYADAASTSPSAAVENGILYFPQSPFSQFSYASLGGGLSPADVVGVACENRSGEALAGLVGTFDLSKLGLVPPFKLK